MDTDVESTTGTFWLVGTAVEHHALYQYQMVNTQNMFLGFIQTETPYWQPSPAAPAPFQSQPSLNDPTYPSGDGSAWGLRVSNSKNILIYGAGLYSFFNSWGTGKSLCPLNSLLTFSDNFSECPTFAEGSNCQPAIASIESSEPVSIYNLNTVGAVSMINENGASMATFSDNENSFASTIALFRS